MASEPGNRKGVAGVQMLGPGQLVWGQGCRETGSVTLLGAQEPPPPASVPAQTQPAESSRQPSPLKAQQQGRRGVHTTVGVGVGCLALAAPLLPGCCLGKVRDYEEAEPPSWMLAAALTRKLRLTCGLPRAPPWEAWSP